MVLFRLWPGQEGARWGWIADSMNGPVNLLCKGALEDTLDRMVLDAYVASGEMACVQCGVPMVLS